MGPPGREDRRVVDGPARVPPSSRHAGVAPERRLPPQAAGRREDPLVRISV
jgi:hypothetical protein